jgi:multisubunit Na+/H+ antiporter MnhE subunit
MRVALEQNTKLCDKCFGPCNPIKLPPPGGRQAFAGAFMRKRSLAVKAKSRAGKATFWETIQSSAAPLAACVAVLATVIGLITNWQAVRQAYHSQPVITGTFAALALALVSWAALGYFGRPRQTGIARIVALALIAVAYVMAVLLPNFCILTSACGPSDFEPYRTNFFASPAFAKSTQSLELIAVKVDQTRSTFLMKEDNFSIHAEREELTRISLEFDRKMLGIFRSASCRSIRGEAPIEDALPIWRSLLKDRGRDDLVQKLSDYNGYRNLIQGGGQKGFLEARPRTAELAHLLKTKPEWYALLMRWMVECVGIADPVLVWTFRNNSSKPLTLTSVDYEIIDIGQVKGAGPETIEPIDIGAHDLYHQKGTQRRDISPMVALPPGATAALRVYYRLQATDWGLTWLVKPVFRTVEGASVEGPEIKIFSAKNKQM